MGVPDDMHIPSCEVAADESNDGSVDCVDVQIKEMEELMRHICDVADKIIIQNPPFIEYPDVPPSAVFPSFTAFNAEMTAEAEQEPDSIESFTTFYIDAYTSIAASSEDSDEYKRLSNNINTMKQLLEKHNKQLKEGHELCNKRQLQLQSDEEDVMNDMQQKYTAAQGLDRWLHACAMEFASTCDAKLSEIRLQNKKRLREQLQTQYNIFNKEFDEHHDLVDYQLLSEEIKQDDELQQQYIDTYEREDNLYSTEKQQLETACHDATLQLEKLLAIYHLNGEKAAYNIKVLRERCKDYLLQYNKRKKKLYSCNQSLLLMKENFKNTYENYKRGNIKISKAYKSLAMRYSQLADIEEQLEYNEIHKFLNTWKSSEEELDGIVRELMDRNKLVYEKVLSIPHIVQYNENDGSVLDLDTTSQPTTTVMYAANQKRGSHKAAPIINTSIFSNEKIRNVCDFILSQCHFLIPSHLQQDDSQSSEHSPEMKQVLSVNQILQYIGAETQQDLDELVSMFYEGQDEDDVNLCTEYEDILNILMQFMEQKASRLRLSMLVEKKRNARRELVDGKHFSYQIMMGWHQDLKKYWDKKVDVFPQNFIALWQVLDNYLQKHYCNLKERKTLYEEVEILEKENQILTKKLNEKQIKKGCSSFILSTRR